MSTIRTQLHISLPAWLPPELEGTEALTSDDLAMGLAAWLATQNVRRGTGGPFAALVLEHGSGRLVSAGVNSVERLGNSLLHAETMALMLAEAALGSYTLRGDGGPGYTLVSTCEPCAMCLGAVLWSGVRRVVCGASRDDAQAAGFDEGPVFPESYRYVETRGVSVVRGVLRDEAAAPLALYRQSRGTVY